MNHARSPLRRLLPTLIILLAVGGCGRAPADDAPDRVRPDSGASADSPSSAEYHLCSDPRPEVCTREYRPVCADRVVEDARVEQVTRPNACEACRDSDVRGHRPGACEAPGEPAAAGRTRIDDAY